MTIPAERRKVYISGKITGDPDYADKFYEAEEKLTAEGHIVLNPAILPEGFTWDAYMRISFAMLHECDTVCFLPDWRESAGAKWEYGEAVAQNKRIIMFQENRNSNK